MSTRIFPDKVARRTQADRSEATRQQLISATIDVVRERAFHGASVMEVSKLAGVTPGAFQHHFGSKAELMMEVVGTILRGNEQGAMRWPANDLTLPERARNTILGLWSALYGTDRFLVAWQVYFGCATDPALRTRLSERRADAGRTLHQQFLLTLPELAANPKAKQVIDLVMSSLRGLGLLRLFDNDPPVTPQLDALVQLLIQNCEHVVPAPETHSKTRKRTT